MFSPLASHSRLQKRQPRAKNAQRKPHTVRKQRHAEPHERDWQHQAQHVQQPLRRALPCQRRDRRMQRAAAVERQHRQQIRARVQQAQVRPLRVSEPAQDTKQPRTGGGACPAASTVPSAKAQTAVPELAAKSVP